jgi:hypothetical protein
LPDGIFGFVWRPPFAFVGKVFRKRKGKEEEFMAVVVTYSSFAADNPAPQAGTPFTGGTTPPSALQASQVNRVNALISFTDTDTTINFTHNWGLSAAGAAAMHPDLIVNDVALGSSNTTPSGITWSVANTNTVVGTKANTAGSGRTISITARKPAKPGN